MSDFHRSLDRALEVDPHNDWGVEPQDPRFAVFKITPDMRAMQDMINKTIAEIAELAALTVWPDDEPVAYDGFGAPLYAHQLPAEGTG